MTLSNLALPRQAAADLLREVALLPTPNTQAVRALRRQRTRQWRQHSPDFVFAVASAVMARPTERWLAFELIRHHPGAFGSLCDGSLRDLAAGLDSWESVDAFGRILSGPAWVRGLASDTLVEEWSCSENRWLRRTALVSTVALNMPMDGGSGDARRTLGICARLAGDRDDMVIKALSWALRALVACDRQSVQGFLSSYDRQLAARVKREVCNKLTSGLKTPRRQSLHTLA